MEYSIACVQQKKSYGTFFLEELYRLNNNSQWVQETASNWKLIRLLPKRALSLMKPKKT